MTRVNASHAVASGLVTLLSVFSAAAWADGPPQVKLSYADLNLSSPQGAKALYHRIQSAAGQVCYPEDQRNLAMIASRRACIEKAIGDAVKQVGSATLTALYNTHEGRTQSLQVASVDKR